MEKELKPGMRIGYLDGVRGIAALCVYFGHFFGAFGFPVFWTNAFRWPPISLVYDGFAAVSMFFVLSGFVLSRKYFLPGTRAFSLKQEIAPFYAARIIRIWLPFAAVLFLSLMAQQFLRLESYPTLVTSWARDMWPAHVSSDSFFRQLALLLPSDFIKHLISQDWTLSRELKASLAIPFFILLVNASSMGFALLICLLTIKSWYIWHFGLGVLTAKYFFTLQQKASALPRHLKALAAVAALALYSRHFVYCWAPEYITWLINGVGSCGLIILIFGSPQAQAFLEKPLFRYLGKISYSLYLVHLIILLCVSPRILFALEDHKFAYLVLWISSLACVILSADICQRLIERPAIWLSHQFRSRQKTLRH